MRKLILTAPKRLIAIYLRLMKARCRLMPAGFVAESRTEAQSIVKRSKETVNQTKQIHKALTGVKDIVPAWLVTLKWLAIAAVVIGIIVALIMSGALPAIRAAFSWLTSLIP